MTNDSPIDRMVLSATGVWPNFPSTPDTIDSSAGAMRPSTATMRTAAPVSSSWKRSSRRAAAFFCAPAAKRLETPESTIVITPVTT